MKVKSIHIYSKDGKRRDLQFAISGLNIITGRSSTGKSSLAGIVEYCAGTSDFNVSEGAVRDFVSWFCVVFSFDKQEVLVAKPTPQEGYNSCSTVMLRTGSSQAAPDFQDLRVNANDDAVTGTLSRLLGIPENETDVPLEHSRDSFRATVKHTMYYLFQDQNLIASKNQLFYKQNEDYEPQRIRDTFPILFGSTVIGDYELRARLKEAQRELKLRAKKLDQALAELNTADQQARRLLSEAQAAGILKRDATGENVVELLGKALHERIVKPEINDDPHIARLEKEISELRKRRRDTQQRIDAARQFVSQANDFGREVDEQMDRLKSISALPKDPESGEWQWPFAPTNLQLESPLAKVLLKELESLQQEMQAVAGERPQLESYMVERQGEIDLLMREIHLKEIELAAALQIQELQQRESGRYELAARTIGRISFFLENLASNQELSTLQSSYDRQQSLVDDLKSKVGTENLGERLKSILNSISDLINEYTKAFDAEFAIYPARFDLSQLTLKFDRGQRPVPLSRTGGGENHLAYHLSVMLALHRFASAQNRPVPRFLMLDQPTQVYFPSENSYKEVGGSIEKTAKDADMESVRKLFVLLKKFTEEDCPGFQLIITEHANLSDQWFQDALVEMPWTKPPALVPLEWIDATNDRRV